RITRQTALDLELVEPLVVETTKGLRQATERPDKPKLGGDDVDHEAEPHLLGRLEASLGFAFSVDERITCREEVSYQSNAAISGIRDVSGSIRRVEAETQKIAAGPHMLFPHNDEAKAETCARPEALQSPLFDQVIAEPSEPITRLVIAKARSSDDAQMNI